MQIVNQSQDLKEQKASKRFVLPIVIGVLTALIGITSLVLVFNEITTGFSSTIEAETAQTMNELTKQAASLVNLAINDKLTALKSFAYSLKYASFENDEQLRDYIEDFKQQRNSDNICLYTETGDCINSVDYYYTPETVPELIKRAETNGYAIGMPDSSISLFVPVYTHGDIIANGKQVKAVSMFFPSSELLNSTTTTSYDGTVEIYLTDKNGKVISMRNTAVTPSYSNIPAELTDSIYTPISGTADSIQQAISHEGMNASILTMKDGKKYYASICHFDSAGEEWGILYTIPVSVINNQTDKYANSITTLGIIIVFSLALIIITVFSAWFTRYSKSVNRSIIQRDFMFNKLVTKTKYAFALLKVGSKSPNYISPNAAQFLDGNIPRLIKDKHGFKWSVYGEGADIDYTELNKQLSQWTGKSELSSEHIRYSTSENSEHYFTIKLYQPDEIGETLCIFQDVSDEHRRELALQAAVKTAEQASYEKSKFLSNMSHDIRTPMNAILNMAYFAKNEPANAQQYVNTIITSAEHLRDLINDILDIARVESGQIGVNITTVDAAAELEKIETIIRLQCASKNQKFTVTANMKHKIIEADSQKVSQILINLLNNAVKFTPNGGEISLKIREFPAFTSGYCFYMFIIKDNGIGMDKKILSSVFQPFIRAEVEAVKNVEGTGLGLSIVKSYTELMGGEIDVESEVGKGSTFTVRFTFKIAQDKPEENTHLNEESEADITGMSIIVAEDDAINQMIIKKILTNLCAKVKIVDNGQQLIDELVSAEPGTYDVVLMDIMMPVKDGLQATAELRKSTRADLAEIPIIALSANAFVQDKERSLRAGMNDHLAKPVDSGQIAKALFNFRKCQ